MFGRRDPRSEEVRDEIRFYLEMRARELEAEGLSPEEAERRAREAFGDPERIEREVMRMRQRSERRLRLGGLLSATAQDLRYALRFLTQNPTFSVVVLATLALGIGANTAIFSLLDQALLRAPAVRDPGSLVAVYTTSRRGFPRSSSSYPDYVDYRDRTATIADLAATTQMQVSLGDQERGARMTLIEAVTANAHELLGLRAALGRTLQPADDATAAPQPVTVLSHALWRDHFGSDPSIVGSTVRLNGRPFEVVGVLAPEYRGVVLGEEPEAWVGLHAAGPLGTGIARQRETIFEERGSRWIGRLVGRLAPGATAVQARAELLALSERLREQDPDARGPRSITVDPLARYLLPLGSEEALRGFVWLLAGVVGATLLLASANLANLLLARAAARRTEIGVRLAIGAGRGRLVRQLLTESVALALVGGAVGLAVAAGLLRGLSAFELPGGVPIGALDVGLDGRVLLAALALALGTALLFGLVPALQTTRPEVVEALKAGRTPGGRSGPARLRGALVATQMALCLVLLIGSGLFVRTLRNALTADLGIDTGGVALARLNLAGAGYDEAGASAFLDELRTRLEALPGARASSVSSLIPFQGGGFVGTFATVDGYELAPDEELRIDLVFVSPDFLETLGIRLLAGRDLSASDTRDAEDVAIVNASMAARYWPDEDAVGGTMRFSDSAIRVVGVADDVRWSSLDEEATNFVFVPLAQTGVASRTFLTAALRTSGDPEELLGPMREQIRSLDPEVSPMFVSTLDDLLGGLLMPQRLGAVLLSAFGLLALLLASVGIAGVVAFRVREQRRAIGVRIALGARSGQVHGLVLRGIAPPLALGLGVGLVAALALRGAVVDFLYEVPSGDPLTYASVAAALVVVAIAASVLAAREASRVDPMEVLKSE